MCCAVANCAVKHVCVHCECGSVHVVEVCSYICVCVCITIDLVVCMFEMSKAVAMLCSLHMHCTLHISSSRYISS